MRDHILLRAGKGLATALCLAICVWCAADALKGWTAENGRTALLFAAGLEADSPAPSPSARPDPTPAAPELFTISAPGVESSREANGGSDSTIEKDEIAPFHADLLPGLSATPEPNRATGPVQEIQADGGAQVADFFVRDTTGSGTDLAAELQEDPAIHIKGDGSVEVLIYHTHTSEAYSQSYTGFYYTDMETRTGNQEKSVVAVGEELKKALEARGIGVVHDTTVNDELYNGSYSRSWEVLQKNLQEHPGIQVTIDLHRDSMTTEEGIKYKPTAVIGGRKAAQIMFLAGCDADGGWGDFPNWRENLRLILRAQQTAQRLYPGFARPLSFSNSKYNMNATTGSMLIEVGTEVNTVSEARYSGQILGEILAETLLACE